MIKSIVLDDTLKSLELVLSGAVSTNQLDWIVAYSEEDTSAFDIASDDGVSNDTTPVTIVAAPSSGKRDVKEIVVYNKDTAAATVTIQLNNNSTVRLIETFTLAAGARWALSEQPASGGGSGDMTKAVYDTNDDGTVDSADTATTAGDADTVDGQHAAAFEAAGAAATHSALTTGVHGVGAGTVAKTTDIAWGSVLGTITNQTDLKYLAHNTPDSVMRNGKISVTVASNNITVAIKTLAGNDPSAGEPVYVRIGDTIRSITAALSVTKNAGTNWFNAGSTELAGQTIDYFVYIGYNATDGVVVGFARIPYARIYSDFSTTTTHEKYCAISTITNAAAGDNYVNIGRFAAVLSAGAGYTWSVPAFTNVNLIQHPIFQTRWLTWAPVFSGSGSMTYTGTSVSQALYRVDRDKVEFQTRHAGTVGGTPSANIRYTLPFEVFGSANYVTIGFTLWDDATPTSGFGGAYVTPGTPDICAQLKYNGANFAAGTANLGTTGFYRIE